MADHNTNYRQVNNTILTPCQLLFSVYLSLEYAVWLVAGVKCMGSCAYRTWGITLFYEKVTLRYASMNMNWSLVVQYCRRTTCKLWCDVNINPWKICNFFSRINMCLLQLLKELNLWMTHYLRWILVLAGKREFSFHLLQFSNNFFEKIIYRIHNLVSCVIVTTAPVHGSVYFLRVTLDTPQKLSFYVPLQQKLCTCSNGAFSFRSEIDCKFRTVSMSD